MWIECSQLDANFGLMYREAYTDRGPRVVKGWTGSRGQHNSSRLLGVWGDIEADNY